MMPQLLRSLHLPTLANGQLPFNNMYNAKAALGNLPSEVLSLIFEYLADEELVLGLTVSRRYGHLSSKTLWEQRAVPVRRLLQVLGPVVKASSGIRFTDQRWQFQGPTETPSDERWQRFVFRANQLRKLVLQDFCLTPEASDMLRTLFRDRGVPQYASLRNLEVRWQLDHVADFRATADLFMVPGRVKRFNSLTLNGFAIDSLDHAADLQASNGFVPIWKRFSGVEQWTLHLSNTRIPPLAGQFQSLRSLTIIGRNLKSSDLTRPITGLDVLSALQALATNTNLEYCRFRSANTGCQDVPLPDDNGSHSIRSDSLVIFEVLNTLILEVLGGVDRIVRRVSAPNLKTFNFQTTDTLDEFFPHHVKQAFPELLHYSAELMQGANYRQPSSLPPSGELLRATLDIASLTSIQYLTHDCVRVWSFDSTNIFSSTMDLSNLQRLTLGYNPHSRYRFDLKIELPPDTLVILSNTAPHLVDLTLTILIHGETWNRNDLAHMRTFADLKKLILIAAVEVDKKTKEATGSRNLDQTEEKWKKVWWGWPSFVRPLARATPEVNDAQITLVRRTGGCQRSDYKSDLTNNRELQLYKSIQRAAKSSFQSDLSIAH